MSLNRKFEKSLRMQWEMKFATNHPEGDSICGVILKICPEHVVVRRDFDLELEDKLNQSLAELLKTAGDVTGILSERSQQVNTLILSANDLLGVLNDRRQAIVSLLANTSAVSRQLTGLVADNEKKLAPTLERLNRVNAMLERNRDNIAKALPGLAKYELTQGEIVANGAYYNALIPNISPAQLLPPFLDYAFGFRRGVDAGQPPDNAGPRAEIPFPVNGIPQPGDLPPR